MWRECSLFQPQAILYTREERLKLRILQERAHSDNYYRKVTRFPKVLHHSLEMDPANGVYGFIIGIINQKDACFFSKVSQFNCFQNKSFKKGENEQQDSTLIVLSEALLPVTRKDPSERLGTDGEKRVLVQNGERG